MSRHLNLRYGHVILVSGYISLQAPTLATKCDISHWFPCGADGLEDGQSLIMDRLANSLLCGAALALSTAITT